MEDIAAQLTEKQRRFCERYCVVWNAARAAREAGYSEKAARETGYELLTKPHIKAYIQQIKDNAAEFAGVSMLRNLQELSKIAYTSAADLRQSWHGLKEWDEISEEAKASISEVVTVSKVLRRVGGGDESEDENSGMVKTLETVKVKQHSKIQAIAEINKMMGYNAPVQMEVTEFEIDFNDSDSDED
jgi:phage terminase small subunit